MGKTKSPFSTPRGPGRPKKIAKSAATDLAAALWGLSNVSAFLQEKRDCCRGNSTKTLQASVDAVTCAFLHQGPPPPGMKEAFKRISGFTDSMLDRAEKLRKRNTVGAKQLNSKDAAFTLERSPHTTGPRQKKPMRWVYSWFHNYELNSLLDPDKQRPERYRGKKLSIEIDGEKNPVECPRHIINGTKKDLVQLFLESTEYKQWQAMNPGMSMSPRSVSGCICPCMKPAQVRLQKPCFQTQTHTNIHTQVNECSCRICTEFEEVLKAWHTQRKVWHKPRQGLPKQVCKCPGCSNPEAFERYMGASRSVKHFRDACLCPKIAFPELAMPHSPEDAPHFRDIACCTLDDKYPVHVSKPCAKCGVLNRLYAHDECIERDHRATASWRQWVMTQVHGGEENGGTDNRMVFRKVTGTRRMLLERIFSLARRYFFHNWLHGVTSHMGRLRNAT
jgi:hypothetical protein